MSVLYTSFLLLLYFLISLFACFRIIPILRSRGIVDVANERSSHKGEQLRGGGLGFMPVLLIGIFAVLLITGAGWFWWLSLATVTGFAALSFLDDLWDLPAGLRFAAHGVLAGILCFSIPSEYVPFQSIVLFTPDIQEPLTRFAMAILFVWWINLYNFMDGIDGISIVQTCTITIGILMFLLTRGTVFNDPLGWLAVLTSLTCIAFAFVNWHPAKVFMGDVGSVGLGALTGILLLYALNQGFEAGFFLLPMYYFFDATSTLIYRILKRQKFWKPHKIHAYQQYTSKGYGHDRTCIFIMGLSITLIFLAINPFGVAIWAGLLTGAILTIGLIAYFRLSR